MALLEPLQPNSLRQPAVWRLHRFTRAVTAADLQRSLEDDVRAFFAAIVEQFAGEGHWMPATAPAKGGGVDVWFRLPAAPADVNFGTVWSRQLGVFGLASQAITSRN